jgi:hypothetical protein
MLRTRNVACVAAVAVGLTLIPASAAMADNTANSARTRKQSASERKQNRRIAALIVKTAKLTTDLTALDGKVTTQGTKIDDIDTRLKGIEAGVPQVLDGLTKLADAATQLKTGLEAAGAGLTKLGAAYQAVEYGRASLFYTNGTAVAGTAVTSADIPDDGNAINVAEDAIVAIPTTAATTINLRAAIRSAESDGDDAAKTAGQAGGFIQVYNGTNGDSIACAGSTAPLGIFGTQPGDSIVTPSGTVTNLPLKNIPGGNLRTDTTHPDGTSTSLLPAACTIAGATAGDVYKVHYSVAFLDIPTTTTPGPTE